MATNTEDPINLGRTCSNHPGVETRLTCSSCGTPICPRCMVPAAVGQKCPDCARQTSRARGLPTLPLVGRVLGVMLAGGAAGGLAFSFLPRFGLFILAALYGFGMGNLARWAAKRRTHTVVGVVAAGGMILGFAGLVLLLGGQPLAPPFLLVYLISGAVTFVRATGVW
jgi:hypothetical protein